MRPFFAAVLECVQCGNTPVENPDTQLCASCSAAIRKAERQAQKVKIVTPPRKVSAKMAKDLQDYGVLRRKHLAEHPECEVNLSGICDGQSNQVHHCAKRGINLLQADTFKAVCQSCHTYIETKMSAEERRERGLLITKNETI